MTNLLAKVKNRNAEMDKIVETRECIYQLHKEYSEVEVSSDRAKEIVKEIDRLITESEEKGLELMKNIREIMEEYMMLEEVSEELEIAISNMGKPFAMAFEEDEGREFKPEELPTLEEAIEKYNMSEEEVLLYEVSVFFATKYAQSK